MNGRSFPLSLLFRRSSINAVLFFLYWAVPGGLFSEQKTNPQPSIGGRSLLGFRYAWNEMRYFSEFNRCCFCGSVGDLGPGWHPQEAEVGSMASWRHPCGPTGIHRVAMLAYGKRMAGGYCKVRRVQVLVSAHVGCNLRSKFTEWTGTGHGTHLGLSLSIGTSKRFS